MYDNLELAFKKARKGKTTKDYVLEFETDLENNLRHLQNQLLLQTYHPQPLKTFILRDPKTRTISKSTFRDRLVHHALCNIIEPFFEKNFIFDSYANRRGKGTLKAVERFDHFKSIVSRNNTRTCFVLKGDIRKYFDNVDHRILLEIVKRKISDLRVLWLIEIILANYLKDDTSLFQKGMPLGNLTSQFFANVYLNELDQFVKHELKIKYYIRYVDDFVILHQSKDILEEYQSKIELFLRERLKLTLHPEKSRILILDLGIPFLGFRLFSHHRLIQVKNIRKFSRKFAKLQEQFKEGVVEQEKLVETFDGWLAYVSHANTHKYQQEILQRYNHDFLLKPLLSPLPLKKHENFAQKIEKSTLQFSVQKTLFFLKRGFSLSQIAERRKIKESTVWGHCANLIEHHQYSLKKIISHDKIAVIKSKISSEKDTLKEIKCRLVNNPITYDEINCVLASVKCNNKSKSILQLIRWYQQTNCFRKCYFAKRQREQCRIKFEHFAATQPLLKMKRKDFLDIFNNYLTICVLPEKEKLNYLSWEKFKIIKRGQTKN